MERQPVAKACGVRYAAMAAARLRDSLPMFSFPSGYAGALEHALAGIIRPRTLIRAQLILAERHYFPGGGSGNRYGTRKGPLVTRSGRSFRVARALIAGGAFANCYDLLERKVALCVKSETTLLAEIPNDEAAQVARMPTLSYVMSRRA